MAGRKRKAWWVAFLPAVLMMVMTLWSLIVNIEPYLRLIRSGAEIELMRHVQFGIVLSLLALSAWLIVEAFITWRTMIRTAVPIAKPSLWPIPAKSDQGRLERRVESGRMRDRRSRASEGGWTPPCLIAEFISGRRPDGRQPTETRESAAS